MKLSTLFAPKCPVCGTKLEGTGQMARNHVIQCAKCDSHLEKTAVGTWYFVIVMLIVILVQQSSFWLGIPRYSDLALAAVFFVLYLLMPSRWLLRTTDRPVTDRDAANAAYRQQVLGDLGQRVKGLTITAVALAVLCILLMLVSDYRSLWPGLPIWIMVVIGVIAAGLSAAYLVPDQRSRMAIPIIMLLMGSAVAFAANFLAVEINGAFGEPVTIHYRLQAVKSDHQLWRDEQGTAPDISLLRHRAQPWSHNTLDDTIDLVARRGPLPFYVMQLAEFERLYRSSRLP